MHNHIIHSLIPQAHRFWSDDASSSNRIYCISNLLREIAENSVFRGLVDIQPGDYWAAFMCLSWGY